MGEQELSSAGFWVAAANRRFLPWSVALCGLAISLLVWGALRENHRSHLRQNTQIEGSSLRNELISRLEFRIRELRDIAGDLSNPKYAFDETVFRSQARLLSVPASGFRVIQTLD